MDLLSASAWPTLERWTAYCWCQAHCKRGRKLHRIGVRGASPVWPRL